MNKLDKEIGEILSRSSKTSRALSLATIAKYEPLAQILGVSEVARSSRGFLSAYKRAGSYSRLPEKWKAKREAFIARHMAQVNLHGEKLWANGEPTRRHLALIMWAYSPNASKL